MKKYLLGIFAALLVAVSFTSCGDDENDSGISLSKTTWTGSYVDEGEEVKVQLNFDNGSSGILLFSTVVKVSSSTNVGVGILHDFNYTFDGANGKLKINNAVLKSPGATEKLDIPEEAKEMQILYDDIADGIILIDNEGGAISLQRADSYKALSMPKL